MAPSVITGEKFAAVSSHWGVFWKGKAEAASNWGILAGALALTVACHGKKWQGTAMSNTDWLLTHPVITELLRPAATENFFGRAMCIAGS